MFIQDEENIYYINKDKLETKEYTNTLTYKNKIYKLHNIIYKIVSDSIIIININNEFHVFDFINDIIININDTNLESTPSISIDDIKYIYCNNTNKYIYFVCFTNSIGLFYKKEKIEFDLIYEFDEDYTTSCNDIMQYGNYCLIIKFLSIRYKCCKVFSKGTSFTVFNDICKIGNNFIVNNNNKYIRTDIICSEKEYIDENLIGYYNKNPIYKIINNENIEYTYIGFNNIYTNNQNLFIIDNIGDKDKLLIVMYFKIPGFIIQNRNNQIKSANL